MKIPNSLVKVLQIAALSVSIAAVQEAIATEESPTESEQVEPEAPPLPSPTIAPYDPHSCIACGMG